MIVMAKSKIDLEKTGKIMEKAWKFMQFNGSESVSCITFYMYI